MKKPTVLELKRKKGERLAMLTAYDFPTARLVAEAGVDLILVGDSLGMVVLGYDSTVPVTVEDMVHHTKAARRGAPEAFLIADMPFLSYGTVPQALANAARLMKEAHAEPFLHPRHRLADRRRRNAKLASRNGETSGFRGLNEGIQRSQTVHPRTSIADNQVRYVWNYGPFFKPSGELILGPTPHHEGLDP